MLSAAQLCRLCPAARLPVSRLGSLLITNKTATPPFIARAFASSSRQDMADSAALVYSKPGEPGDVLELKQVPPGDLGKGQIRVRMLKAPINPSDVNTVQGKYPIQPASLPGVPGHEGVGEVVEVGPEVGGLGVGDRVVPLEPGQGTWRRVGVFTPANWHRIPKDVDVDQAAQLCINPPTAMALLDHYVQLKPGDVVVLNGGTSAVGQLVVQLARLKGLKTVSVIRDRPNWDETVEWLKGLGADLVTTDDRLKEDLKAAKLGPAPRLGLNCVGGQSALAVTKVLAEGGTLVTYGGMSMQPVSLPTSLLIFKDITFRGFWLSGRFAQEQGAAKRAAVLDELAEYMRQGKLVSHAKSFPLAQYKEALAEVNKQHRGTKVLLDMTA